MLTFPIDSDLAGRIALYRDKCWKADAESGCNQLPLIAESLGLTTDKTICYIIWDIEQAWGSMPLPDRSATHWPADPIIRMVIVTLYLLCKRNAVAANRSLTWNVPTEMRSAGA